MAPPTGTIPPELPPSVEEAYRAKCIQLKQRLIEVEEANDNARARITRITRGIQKSRLERAFLLEQLAKRTSTNVEDSEGSPSPPPTPKEKPLRTKRGHRKPEYMTTDISEGRSGNTFTKQGPATISPSSDAISHTHPDPHQNATPQTLSQISKRQQKSSEISSNPAIKSIESNQVNQPKNGLDIYCNELRPRLANEHKKEITEGSYDLEAALIKSWSSLDAPQKNEYNQKYELIKKSNKVGKDTSSSRTSGQARNHGRPVEEVEEEDVEMTDSVDIPVAVPEIKGFTPVNRS